MFEVLNNQVQFHYVSGKSLEEVLAMKELTAPYDAEGFGDGFIKTKDFLTVLYEHATRKFKGAQKKQ